MENNFLDSLNDWGSILTDTYEESSKYKTLIKITNIDDINNDSGFKLHFKPFGEEGIIPINTEELLAISTERPETLSKYIEIDDCYEFSNIRGLIPCQLNVEVDGGFVPYLGFNLIKYNNPNKHQTEFIYEIEFKRLLRRQNPNGTATLSLKPNSMIDFEFYMLPRKLAQNNIGPYNKYFKFNNQFIKLLLDTIKTNSKNQESDLTSLINDILLPNIEIFE